ncbi:uracil phosphoribosyltransferase [Roseivirga misakiensis]|uniref:Uracil phosphoribosyltransferase n=1 Tax=Roseivirga misakiensis TaxID=1563681 RepID=A0A1E5T5I6_9BACT|nr:uracil phosphoribosyltransferase [Roseivirga misakiensis]OEK06608.1 uracil phosphoribosyltransferase [Roseivirga misakiensis]
MFVLNEKRSVANNFLAQLRAEGIQNDRLRFRENLKRLGTLLAYEVSKKLSYSPEKIKTSLAETSIDTLSDDLVIISILRAAVPFTEGFVSVFDNAEVGFIGAARKEAGETIDVDLDYLAAPDLTGKTVIIVDPMLATGKSLVKSVESLSANGAPKSVHLASVIAAPEGIEFINENLALDFSIWTCALDEKLNEKSYIIPGLGDAGDLAFGPKL